MVYEEIAAFWAWKRGAYGVTGEGKCQNGGRGQVCQVGG